MSSTFLLPCASAMKSRNRLCIGFGALCALGTFSCTRQSHAD